MIDILLPVAGRSSRFPDMKPKWMLTHPRGDMMIIKAIKGLNLENVNRIYIIALAQHEELYRIKESLSTQLKSMCILQKVEFIFLEKSTKNQPETVSEAIRIAGITGGIYIKDSDNYFNDTPTCSNAVACYDLHNLDKVNARSKSYIEVDKNGFLTNIVEKKIVSSLFCTGGYSFASAEEYLAYFDKLNGNKDLYISHIIYSMILDGAHFSCSQINNYIDWGTLREWRAYTRQYSSLFVDLDGTLVINAGQYSDPCWGQTNGIQDNIDAINALYNSGKAEVIITTSRKKSFQEVTIEQLKRVGIKYHQIIFDLPHGNRIIINDYAKTNPFKSCNAINIKRNSPDLKAMIEDSVGYLLEINKEEDEAISDNESEHEHLKISTNKSSLDS